MVKKIWHLKYVVGNPAMFSRVTSCSDNPMSRSEALNAAEMVSSNGGGWRVWVEREGSGERIFESASENEYPAAQPGQRRDESCLQNL